jgi:hypothetical protein
LLAKPVTAEVVTVTPEPLDFSAPELVNSMRGLYKWGIDGYYGPEGLPPPQPTDSYQRYEWVLVEPEPGAYDFSFIEKEAEAAKAVRRKFAFRISVVNEFYNLYAGRDAAPDYLKTLVGGTTCPKSGQSVWVPNWDNPLFLERAKALVDTLAAKYDADPRISYYDIGIYGDYGEWHNYGLCPAPSDPNQSTVDASVETKRALVDIQVDAFKKTRVLMNSGGGEVDAFVYALSKSPRVGIRGDSTTANWFTTQFENWPPNCASSNNCKKFEAMRDRWKTAPFATDPMDDTAANVAALIEKFHLALIANSGTVVADPDYPEVAKRLGYRFVLNSVTRPEAVAPGQGFTLSSAWSNVGVTPAYEPFTITWELRDATGASVARASSSRDLEKLLPTTEPESTDDCFAVPAALTAGTYSLHVGVVDPNNYSPPLALAIAGVQADGFYQLGNVDVAEGANDDGACTPVGGTGGGTPAPMTGGMGGVGNSGGGASSGAANPVGNAGRMASEASDTVDSADGGCACEVRQLENGGSGPVAWLALAAAYAFRRRGVRITQRSARATPRQR